MNIRGYFICIVACVIAAFGNHSYSQNNKFTIVYNNIASDNSCLKTDWGFSAWIEADGQVTLFDAGTKPKILQNNLEKLELNPERIKRVAISHEHQDHTGGLRLILKQLNTGTKIYLPNNYDPDLRSEFPTLDFIVNTGFVKIAENIWLSPVLVNQENNIKEQALIIEKENSFIVITGCAHPGIVEICETVCEFFPDKNPELVTGGFHLVRTNADQIKQISSKLRKMGFRHVAPSHCTGEKSIALFQQEWNDEFVQLNLGDSYSF